MRTQGKESAVVIHGIRMSGVEYDEWNYLESRKKLKGQFTTFLDSLTIGDECYGVEWIYARGDTVWVSDEWYRCDHCRNFYRYRNGWSVPKSNPDFTFCFYCAHFIENRGSSFYRYTEVMYENRKTGTKRNP